MPNEPKFKNGDKVRLRKISSVTQGQRLRDGTIGLISGPLGGLLQLRKECLNGNTRPLL
jgi:hypothetical protein